MSHKSYKGRRSKMRGIAIGGILVGIVAAIANIAMVFLSNGELCIATAIKVSLMEYIAILLLIAFAYLVNWQIKREGAGE
ncbi:MAG: hypothetical protein V1649_04335 [Patescibacteria group bacterium]